MKYLFFIITFFCTLCLSSTFRLSEKDDNATIHLGMEDDIVIQVKTNPTTGYKWNIEYDDQLMKLKSDEIKAEEHPSGMVGYPNTRELHFSPLSSGRCVITLNYQRSWEAHKAPIRTLTYTIIIN